MSRPETQGAASAESHHKALLEATEADSCGRPPPDIFRANEERCYHPPAWLLYSLTLGIPDALYPTVSPLSYPETRRHGFWAGCTPHWTDFNNLKSGAVNLKSRDTKPPSESASMIEAQDGCLRLPAQIPLSNFNPFFSERGRVHQLPSYVGIPPVFCLSVASATLLVYDVLCTVDQEIAYVWFAPWTPLKFLFFLNRYIPFVGIFMGIHSMSNSSLNLCFYANIPASDEGDLYSRAVLILRTYILWDRKRWVLILLSALLISTLAAGFVFTNGYREHEMVPMTYAFVLIAETGRSAHAAAVIMVLTVSRAFRHLRQTHSSWIFELYKSGCLFYICLFACIAETHTPPVLSLTNLLLPVFAPANTQPRTLKISWEPPIIWPLAQPANCPALYIFHARPSPGTESAKASIGIGPLRIVQKWTFPVYWGGIYNRHGYT
ncbi:hypothetical protein BD779DRAFT_1473002 [Infundibulicybe gibba]|nr:hypothetical protein BD779DRAFT_1473002 [Infundibulicybe gibba]